RRVAGLPDDNARIRPARERPQADRGAAAAGEVNAVVGGIAGVEDDNAAGARAVHAERGAATVQAALGEVIDTVVANAGLLENHQIITGKVGQLGLAGSAIGARSQQIVILVGLIRDCIVIVRGRGLHGAVLGRYVGSGGDG